MSLNAVSTAVQDDKSWRIKSKLTRELGETLCECLKNPQVVEIMLNPDGAIWLEELGKPMVAIEQMEQSRAQSLISTVASSLDTTVTRENPILECEFPLDGSRFEALIPPVASAPIFTIRRKASKVFSLDDYVTAGIMTSTHQKAIMEAVEQRKNILVVGGTGTGKTTLTNAIIGQIVNSSPQHRLVIIEDTAEIQCLAENTVILHSTESISMLRLLKATMRLRPDRIIVGEVRGPEALALLKAWNTGHPGGTATLHANNAKAGLIRLEQLIAEATQAPMQTLIGEAVDLIVSIIKTPTGRRVEEILSLHGYKDNQYITNAE